MNYYINDFGIHFLGGLGLSGVDRLFSKDSKRHTEQRIEDKVAEVEALTYLEKHDSQTDSSDEYANAVDKARDFFERTGVYTTKKSFLEKTIDTAKSFRTTANERLNNLPAGKTLAFAYAVELTGDVGVLISSVTTGVGNVVSAFGETTYEGFAAFLGIQTGKLLLAGKDYCLRSRDEKDLDNMAKELTSNGKLLEAVRNYSPAQRLERKVLEESSSPVLSADDSLPIDSDDVSQQKPASYDASQIGARVGETLTDVAEGVTNAVSSGLNAIKNRIESRRQASEEAEERRKADLRDKFDKF